MFTSQYSFVVIAPPANKNAWYYDALLLGSWTNPPQMWSENPEDLDDH